MSRNNPVQIYYFNPFLQSVVPLSHYIGNLEKITTCVQRLEIIYSFPTSNVTGIVIQCLVREKREKGQVFVYKSNKSKDRERVRGLVYLQREPYLHFQNLIIEMIYCYYCTLLSQESSLEKLEQEHQKKKIIQKMFKCTDILVTIIEFLCFLCWT